ncbi:hypothetical protein EEJ42_18515 [Streptomyces botrytidirepellens]|uniref:Uncharacterized protein n=1 Tax=Streptomyces botrytidirepellens TaxID=2486417 RepID=A0A3M8W509_9ACTN|nr:hypothetical protein EEJ42_18515 [Streptomyces botrytidirepellens]
MEAQTDWYRTYQQLAESGPAASISVRPRRAGAAPGGWVCCITRSGGKRSRWRHTSGTASAIADRLFCHVYGRT